MTAANPADFPAPKRKTRGLVSISVALFERLMPDPFVIAIGLTFIVALAALVFAPKGTPLAVLNAWYAGIFGILAFAFQMILILVTGHALASAPPIQRGIRSLVSLARTPNQAMAITFLTVALASWLNWGFGLVIAAMLSREVAGRMRVDFGWLVAAAYSGWVVWASGFSSSIALAQASPGNALNIVEKLTGHVLPFGTMVFAPFNLVPNLLIVLIGPVAFVLIRPREDDMIVYEPAQDVAAASKPRRGNDPTAPARRMEQSPVSSLLLCLAGALYLGVTWWTKGFSLDINTVIFIFLIGGIALHGAPVNYVDALGKAARSTGSMMLQYPLYGGIMGIMSTTGLAEVISKSFVTFSTAGTLPFWSYVCSLFITFLVPSGGGHWAVQGPFIIPAATQLHASLPGTAMAVAMGENAANMLQPFWMLPVVAIAGIGIQRVMGYTIVTFAIAAVIYGGAMLLLL